MATGGMIAFASITSFVDAHSRWALLVMFGLLVFESFGLPIPGETALIACGVLASQGALPIAWVILAAILAAIIGDNLGYWTARQGGRRLLYHTRFTRRYAERYLPKGESFFARHGGKAVFIGRFIAILRVTAAWTAGLSHMDWWRFLFWNALGGIFWATAVSLVSYYLGNAAAGAIGRYGFYAAGGALLLAALGYVVVRKVEKRVVRDE